jgi:CRP/FNR family transcriptional regulator
MTMSHLCYSETPRFSTSPEMVPHTLATIGEVFPAGVELLAQGELPRSVYVVQRGLIKLSRLSSDGREAIVGLRGPASLIGAAEVLLGKLYAATATCATRCTVLRLEANEFQRRLCDDPDLCAYLLQQQSAEVYEQMLGMAELANASARQRLEQLLWTIVVGSHPSVPTAPVTVRLPLKCAEVARLLGITPQYFSELLTRLESEGTIRRLKDGLRVLEPLRLAHVED